MISFTPSPFTSAIVGDELLFQPLNVVSHAWGLAAAAGLTFVAVAQIPSEDLRELRAAFPPQS